MGYNCDYCGDARSMVYCRSDAAYLCLSCDRNVHSANPLSKRHSRTLVCDRCNSQPASVRCVEEKASFCHNCDWVAHNGSNSGSSTHSRQTLNCYSGCPSALELSSIWPFMADSPSVINSNCEKEMGSMSIADNSQGPSLNNNNQDLFAPIQAKDLQISTKGPEQYIDDGFYDDFDMDEVDLSIENYEELFGVGHNDPENLFAKDGIDSLFGAESNCQVVYTLKESSTGRGNVVQPAASFDSLMSCKTEPNACYVRQHSNISFSSLTGESSAGEYQDCGASSMLLMGEPPWATTAPETTTTSGSRSDAVLRYKEKKKMRKFEKRVRYATRKARADVRKRVKGRFVKAGEEYDYDPMSQSQSQTRSF